jgi:uncharacterized membrane protein
VRRILDDPAASLGAGLALSLVLLVALLTAGSDTLSFVSFLLRLLHVPAAMVWIGLVVFVNFVQLAVLKTADEAGRDFLHANVVPRVAWWFRHASTVVVVSGVLLLVTRGYLFPALVYGTEVHVATVQGVLLWLGVAGGLVMWMLVHMYIWPAMQVVLGLRPGDVAAKTAARQRVIACARINLILALPVTLAMLAAAHL